MKPPHDRLIRLIAVFKLVKAALLIALGIGVFQLLHKDIADLAEHWIEALRLDPANRFLDAALAKSSNLSPEQIKELGLGSFIYAGLFLIEGLGLWLLKPWAEWLTIIITSSLAPIEIYEIHRHPSSVKIGVLSLNLAIVAYLIYRLRGRRKILRTATPFPKTHSRPTDVALRSGGPGPSISQSFHFFFRAAPLPRRPCEPDANACTRNDKRKDLIAYRRNAVPVADNRQMNSRKAEPMRIVQRSLELQAAYKAQGAGQYFLVRRKERKTIQSSKMAAEKKYESRKLPISWQTTEK